MKLPLFVLTLTLSVNLTGAEPAQLPIPSEHAAIAAMADGIFGAPPTWEEKRGEKTLVWKKDSTVIQVTIDEETGHAVGFDSNGTPMTNARLRQLAALVELRELHYGHSGQWHCKEIPMEEFSGAGLEVLADSKVEHLKIGGSHFGEPGLLAIAKMKNLRSLDFNHVPVTGPGMEAIAQHPGLKSFGSGMQHDPPDGRYGSWPSMIPVLMKIPNLEELSIREVFLTWDTGLNVIAENGARLKRIEFGRGSVILPEDAERLRQALPEAEIVFEPYDKALNGNKRYAERLRALMTEEQFTRLKELAAAKK